MSTENDLTRRPGSIHVGCVGYDGARARYWGPLDTLELSAAELDKPKLSTLQRWRREAPETGRFVVGASPGLAAAGFTGAAAEAAWAETLARVEALGASTVLLRTTAAFRPTAANRRNLVEFFERNGQPELELAWWAEGLWESAPEDRDALCAKAGLLPVVDPLAIDEDEVPQGPRFYWRIFGRRGMQGRFSDYELDRLAAFAEGREGGSVVFTTGPMMRDARTFATLAQALYGSP